MSLETSVVPFFAALFFLLILTTTTGGHDCPIKITPPSVVVRYGDPVTINCSSLTDKSLGIAWEATQGGTGLAAVSHLSWSVERLTDWNIVPYCSTYLSDERQCNIHAEVILYTFPNSTGISSTAGSYGIMREGTAYDFKCDVGMVAPVGRLTVTLYRGDTDIDAVIPGNTGKNPVNQSYPIQYVPNRSDDGVTFRCEALLDLEPEGPKLRVFSEPYKVSVQFGPEILCLNSTVEGETLEDLCNVTGKPEPVVTWFRDGKVVDPTVSLSRGYTGPYTIKAEGASLVSKMLRPAVYYEPELFCPNIYTVLEHTPHNLTCTVEGYPQPLITWYKDGEEVDLPENLTRRDAGQYQVVAANFMGNVNTTVDITVVYPPSPIAELEDTEVGVGSPVWLKCSSMGIPRPQYKWDYYRTDNVVVENDDGVSRLLIENTTMLNMGSYTCYAQNDGGIVSKTVRVLVKGARQECPLQMSLEKMVTRYQSESQMVTCEPTASGSRNIEGKASWQLQHGNKTQSDKLSIDPSKDWDLQAACTATFTGIGTCHKPLHFTLYKMPDGVSVRRLDNLGAVVEKQQFQLQCNVTSVAPARLLSVRWYQGNRTLPSQGKGCPAENVTGCDLSATRSPVDVSSTITVALDRSDSGTSFWCEAQLDLGPDGPQPPPKMASSPLNITVYYKPTINTTKLPKVVPVFQGYPEELICEVDGYPPPKIQWFSSANTASRVSGNTLLVTEAGYYNCCATNDIDSVFHVVEVVLKEDYLPLIAGLVAITVIAISVIFIFIYSIYYKNTKMRRYSLKNPKLNAQNGNVAHNGWESQFSMASLS